MVKAEAKKKKKSKRSKNKSKDNSENAEVVNPESVAAPGRDFGNDLNIYLETWRLRESQPWKFNKNLQIWAIANCLDKTKIDSVLFKKLCPYLSTVLGSARERLLENIKSIIEKETVSEDSSEKSPATVIKRCIKIQKLFS